METLLTDPEELKFSRVISTGLTRKGLLVFGFRERVVMENAEGACFAGLEAFNFELELDLDFWCELANTWDKRKRMTAVFLNMMAIF